MCTYLDRYLHTLALVCSAQCTIYLYINVLTSSNSDTFSPKFRMLSSFSASRSLTFISSSCRQLIISSFCRMISALKEISCSGLEGSLVASTISDSFRIRSLAVSNSPVVSMSCCLIAASSNLDCYYGN